MNTVPSPLLIFSSYSIPSIGIFLVCMQLTREQQHIVRHSSGHALVSAVAGSGKTTTMVARVQYLLEQGVAPDKLLVLMFNRSAREAFAHRMKECLRPARLRLPEVRTYHSLGLRLIDSFTRKGVLPTYTLVADERARGKLAKQALNVAYKQENGDHAWVTKEDLEEFLRFIDLVKANTDSVEHCFQKEGLSGKCSFFIEGFLQFEIARKQQRCRFFEDLVYEPLLAMQGNAELTAWVSNRVEHIIVDEYQDINEVQQQLLRILAGNRASVMVVGDVDQCIYEWRGARPDYITNRFQHDFVAPSRYTLSSTFRYGHRVSLAANHLISRNRQRDRKMCISASGNRDTRLTRYVESVSHPILPILTEWQQRGRSLTEAVVLVRLYGMSVPLELALLESDISYRLEGHEQVFGCREIQALTGYLKLCNGTLMANDFEPRRAHLLAMLSQPHIGICQEELEKLVTRISADIDGAPECILKEIKSDMPVFIKKKLYQTAEDWQWMIRQSGGKRADLLLEEIIARLDLYTFYQKFSSRQVTAENRIETCRAFIDFAVRQKQSAVEFLAKLQSLQAAAETDQDGGILITSIHRAKGREWPLVIVPGLKDGSFPFIVETDGADVTLEDERRLFYVAITRAIDEVALIHPPDAFLEKRLQLGVGTYPERGGQASRFLYEANLGLSDLLGAEIVKSQSGNAGTQDAIQAVELEMANSYLDAVGVAVGPVKKRREKSIPAKRRHPLRISDLASGVKVHHTHFGDGVIVDVVAREQGRIRVSFQEYGEKTLLLSFAPLMLGT